jgi:hypothetical protein
MTAIWNIISVINRVNMETERTADVALGTKQLLQISTVSWFQASSTVTIHIAV